jgi:AbiU2
MPVEAPSRAKWERWLDKLRVDVLTLHLYRKFWRDVVRAAEAANVPPSYFFTFFTQVYLTYQAIAIRRLCKARHGQPSFRNLLTEIRLHPALTKNATDPKDVAADIQGLDAGSLGRVRKYADEQVAHKQEAPPKDIPTIEDVHLAIDQIGTLLRKYLVLVLDEDQWLETSVAGDVMAPFRMAWLPPLPRQHRP